MLSKRAFNQILSENEPRHLNTFDVVPQSDQKRRKVTTHLLAKFEHLNPHAAVGGFHHTKE